jgi:O-antigen ligase
MMATPSNGHSTAGALSTPNALKSLAFYCFWVFNLANISRILEFTPSGLHIPLILGAIASLGAVLGGGVGRTLRSTIGMSMIALTALYAANVPFSFWRGGSLSTFTGEWLKSVLVFLVAGSVVMTLRHCRWALYSVAMGAALETVIVAWKGTMIDGRLALTSGSFANPNTIAGGLLWGLPCLGLMFVDPRAGKFRKLLVGAMIVGALMVLLRTGSRGGLIGLAVIGFCVFLRVSLSQKVLMILAVGVLVAIVGALLPDVVARRYATTFSGAEAASGDRLSAGDAASLGGAVGSTRARMALFLRSLKVTMEHPIMGCGIGQFGTYTAGLDTEAGRRAGWQGTHNTYTQVSSEAGIPAFIVYMVLLVSCFGSVGACYRRAVRIQTTRARDIANVAYALRTWLWAYAVSTMFSYSAYSAALPLIAGLTVGFFAAAQPELALAEREMAEAGAASVAAVRPARKLRLDTIM